MYRMRLVMKVTNSGDKILVVMKSTKIRDRLLFVTEVTKFRERSVPRPRHPSYSLFRSSFDSLRHFDSRISVLALARPQQTPALAPIPRLSALNPAHRLRRQAPRLVRPLTDVDRTGSTTRRPTLLHAKPFWSRKLLVLARATLPARRQQPPDPVQHVAEQPPV